MGAVFMGRRLGVDGGVAYIKTLHYPNLHCMSFSIYVSLSYKKILPEMRTHKTNFRRRSPYWNFFRVVLAGWMIRYPKQTVFIPLGFLLVLIYNAVVK
jgi:hypothetical protein